MLKHNEKQRFWTKNVRPAIRMEYYSYVLQECGDELRGGGK